VIGGERNVGSVCRAAAIGDAAVEGMLVQVWPGQRTAFLEAVSQPQVSPGPWKRPPMQGILNRGERNVGNVCGPTNLLP